MSRRTTPGRRGLQGVGAYGDRSLKHVCSARTLPDSSMPTPAPVGFEGEAPANSLTLMLCHTIPPTMAGSHSTKARVQPCGAGGGLRATRMYSLKHLAIAARNARPVTPRAGTA